VLSASYAIAVLKWTAIIALCLYAGVAAVLYLTQRSLMYFPETIHMMPAQAGLPEAGAHRLRHSAATGMLRAGAPLAEIGQVLRHRSMSTTAIYAKADHGALAQLAVPWPGGRP